MGEQTEISWTDHTFNPWIGCTKVSDGCKHCYAESLMDKRWGKVQWGPNGERKRTSDANWREPLKWARKAFDTFGRKARVFCASLADIGEDRPELEPWRADLCDLIRETRDRIDWQLLTKRPENLTRLFPEDVLASCWLGTSTENQPTADERIPHMLRCPAAVRFLSVEPMLGPVDLRNIRLGTHRGEPHYGDALTGFDASTSPPIHNSDGVSWVIVGGESGHGARGCSTAWIRSIVEQCRSASVPCFVKQLGARPFDDPVDGPFITLRDKKGGDLSEWPADLRVREFPHPQPEVSR